MKHFILFIILGCGFLFQASAQDKLYLRNQKEPLVVKILEIGIDEIKYKPWPVTDSDPIIVILKDKVDRVVLQSGDVYRFSTLDEELRNPENVSHQKVNNFKFRLLSPLYGATTVAYERSLRPGRSFEIAANFIGLGFDATEENPRGMMIRVGMKIINIPDVYVRNMRYTHRLKGFYVRPDVTIGSFQLDMPQWITLYDPNTGMFVSKEINERQTVTAGTVSVGVGYQWIIDDMVSLDWFMSLGYGFTSNKYYDGRYYGFVGVLNELPLAFNTGFFVGFLTK